MQKGNISVQTENIFPIIKQFLYSDQDIFLRELVSNAVDATNKLKALSSKGVYKEEVGDTTIDVIVNETEKTITIRDRGIGMSEEEVNKYLNQVAFSSASEFLEKYKTESIIGHFGLGFYSAFMVAKRVEVVTKSHQGTPAVKWSCEGDPEYTLEPAEKQERGTDIILHVSDDAEEFLKKDTIQGLLDKYCKFLSVPIRFGTKTETVPVEDAKEDDEEKTKSIEVDNIVNNPNPLWKKSPSELKDEDYINFYNELYPMAEKPMFWIHLNIDFPFNLTGVLYFPKVKNSLEVQKNKVHLYSNQVYVTDNVSEIVPEFLTLLHGVIDSPDIPLNVSRSYLQSDKNVKKITSYITKKVADKLNELFKKDRKMFESKWADLGLFVKYGMVTEEKFYDKAKSFALLENINNEYFTIDEYKEKIEATQKDKHDKIVNIYTYNKDEHHTYINAATNKGYDVLNFDNVIDNHFMQQLEYKLGDVTFVRVDSDTPDNLVQKDETVESVMSEKEQEKVKGLFEAILDKGKETLQLKPLSANDAPVLITKPEFMRRMKEMQSMQGMSAMMPDMYNVVINTNHPVVAQKLATSESEDDNKKLTQYLYNLALLNQNMLKGEQLSKFTAETIALLQK